LTAENEGLRKQIKVIQGRVVELRRVEVANSRLKHQLEQVIQELESCRYRQATNQTTISNNLNVTPIDKKRLQRSDISNQIKSKLAQLRIDLNTTLAKLIKFSLKNLV